MKKYRFLLLLFGVFAAAGNMKTTYELLLHKHYLFATATGLVGILVSIRVFTIVRMLRVSRAPGWGLRQFADLCFSQRTCTQVLGPALSDMQKEHFEALAAGRPWKARMVLLRGYWSFWSAVLAQLPISLARRVFEIWKATKTGG